MFCLLPYFTGVLCHEIFPSAIFLFRYRIISLEIMTNSGCQSVGCIQLGQHRLLRDMQETLQHSRHLFFGCISVTGNRHLDLQRCIFEDRNFAFQCCCHSNTLRPSQLQHTLYVLPEERCFDCQFVRVILVDKGQYPFEYLFQTQVMVLVLIQLKNAHSFELRFIPFNLQNAVSHHDCSGVNTQYDTVFRHDSRSISSNKVLKPTSFVPKRFTSSCCRSRPSDCIQYSSVSGFFTWN